LLHYQPFSLHGWLGYARMLDVMPTAIEMGVFNAAWDLHLRVCPEPLSAAWWLVTGAVVDVKSAQLSSSLLLPSQVKKMPSTACPELVLLTVPNFREYFYTKIRFSTPGSKFSWINLGSKRSDWPNVPVLIQQL
jgi:hypothetical protein